MSNVPDDDDDRPRTTGRSLVLIRESLSVGEALTIVGQMTPPQAPPTFLKEIRVLPNKWILAPINARPGDVLPPPLLFDTFEQRIVVEAEHFFYHYPGDDVDDQIAAPGWHLDACGISEQSPTGKEISVAVLDSGFDRAHPDFPDKVADDDFVSFIGGEADDSDDHGTHCAGVVCGPKVSTSGVRYGVAPDVRLIIGRVIDSSATSTFGMDLIAGMLWAHGRGADIISLSLGTTQKKCDPTSFIFELLTWILLEAGTMIVGAVGNSSNRKKGKRRPIHHPVDSPEILAVAALEPDLYVWNCSCPSVCGQRNPSIAMPGRNIFSAIPTGIDAVNPFRAKTGTSSATPLAAGVAALWAEATGTRGRSLFNLLENPANVTLLPDPHEDIGRGMLKSP